MNLRFLPLFASIAYLCTPKDDALTLIYDDIALG